MGRQGLVVASIDTGRIGLQVEIPLIGGGQTRIARDVVPLGVLEGALLNRAAGGDCLLLCLITPLSEKYVNRGEPFGGSGASDGLECLRRPGRERAADVGTSEGSVEMKRPPHPIESDLAIGRHVM